MINADANIKNWLIKVNVIINLFRILVYVNVNVINRVMLETARIMKIVNVKNRLIDKLVLTVKIKY